MHLYKLWNIDPEMALAKARAKEIKMQDKVTIQKRDMNLWPSGNAWLNPEMLKNGITLQLVSGRDIAFLPSSDRRCLVPARGCSGFSEWCALEYGAVVEAEILE